LKTLSLKKKININRKTQIFNGLFSFETLFVIFLFAGLYKADPRLEWVSFDLTALFFGLSIIAGLIILIKKGLIFKRKSMILVLLYMAFAGYVLLTYLWTPGKIYSTQKLLYIWTLVFWALTAPALIISTDPIRIKRLGIIYILFSSIVAIEALTYYFMAGQQGFITVFGSNYLGLGRVISLAFLLLIAYFMFWARNVYWKLFTIIMASLYLWLLLVTGGRGPFLAAILSGLIPLIFTIHLDLKKKIIRVRKYVVPILIMVIVSISLFVYLSETGHMTQTYSRLLVLTQTGMGDSAGERLQHYVHAIEYWKQAPIFGYGIGSWPIIDGGIDMRGYPHNIVLEILVELGLVGLLIFFILILYALLLLAPVKSIGDEPIKIFLLMLMVYMLLNSMVSGDIPDNRLLFACIGMMPIALYFKEKR